MVIEKKIEIKYTNESGKNYIYKLTKQNYSKVEEYGIEIIREDIDKGKITNIVKENVDNISSDKDEVSDLLGLLSKNQVSPIHLKDIVCDYIDR